VHGLARTCLARGHNVTVIMPFYECLPQDQIEGLGFDMEIEVPKGKSWDGVIEVGRDCGCKHDANCCWCCCCMCTFPLFVRGDDDASSALCCDDHVICTGQHPEVNRALQGD
jgi:hypothetical protein